MTDRDLLERAAKAAGIELESDDKGQPGFWGDWRGLPQWVEWNPLEDDGDALRLAVKLELSVRVGVVGLPNGCIVVEYGDDRTSDDYAATRRAIVRAAASLAKE